MLGFEQSIAEIKNDSLDNAANGQKNTKSFLESLMGSKEEDVNQERQKNL